MSTSSGNTDQPYKIRCYDDRYVLVRELQESCFKRAKAMGLIQRKERFKRVLIRLTKNVKPGKPYEWRFNPNGHEWVATKVKEEHPILFQEAV